MADNKSSAGVGVGVGAGVGAGVGRIINYSW